MREEKISREDLFRYAETHPKDYPQTIAAKLLLNDLNAEDAELKAKESLAAMLQIESRIGKVVEHLERMREPHWTTTPTFWVALIADIAGVSGVFLAYWAWQHPKAITASRIEETETLSPEPPPPDQSPKSSPSPGAILAPTQRRVFRSGILNSTERFTVARDFA